MRISDWSSDVCSSDLLCPPVMAQQNEAPATAVSEEDGSDPGDIVVMARKREERLQDVPLSIAAISGDTVANERLFRISDYAGKIPNFSALKQNTRTSGLYIRGVGGNANNDGAEPGVGLIRSEEHTSEIQSLRRTSYDVFCMKNKQT